MWLRMHASYDLAHVSSRSDSASSATKAAPLAAILRLSSAQDAAPSGGIIGNICDPGFFAWA
jgi:hypothetical protein